MMNQFYNGKRLPEYYDTMYLDGYTPEEILQAKRKSMLKKGSIKDADVVLSKNQEKELEKQIEICMQLKQEDMQEMKNKSRKFYNENYEQQLLLNKFEGTLVPFYF